MRLTPWAASSPAYLASCEPLVVSVSSSSCAGREVPRQRGEQRHDAAAYQRLAAGEAKLAHAARDESRAQPVEFLERQQVGLRQERHVLRHAIDAAEIAAVGHRDAQIGDRAAERIDQRRPRRRAVDIDKAFTFHFHAVHQHAFPCLTALELHMSQPEPSRLVLRLQPI